MRLLSILVIALAGHFSFAASEAPQYLWQAGGGDHVVELGYNYSNIAIETEGVANETTVHKNRISLGYEYGFSDMMSVGANITYTTGQTDTGPTSKNNLGGIEFLGLDFKGNTGLGFGKLYYGLNTRLSVEDFEVESNGDINSTTGHHTIAPFVALAIDAGSKHNLGLKVAYEYNTETKIDNALDPTQENLEAGHGLLIGAYVERELSDKSTLGLAVNYASYDDYELADSGTEVRGTDGTNNISIDLYGAVGCGCSSGGMEFLPKVSYIMVDDENGNKTADVESSGGSYAVEFAFRKSF